VIEQHWDLTTCAGNNDHSVWDKSPPLHSYVVGFSWHFGQHSMSIMNHLILERANRSQHCHREGPEAVDCLTVLLPSILFYFLSIFFSYIYRARSLCLLFHVTVNMVNIMVTRITSHSKFLLCRTDQFKIQNPWLFGGFWLSEAGHVKNIVSLVAANRKWLCCAHCYVGG